MGVVEVCAEMIHAHPEPILQAVSLLWSINEKLSGRDGLEIEKPNQDWVVDIFKVVRAKAKREEKEREKQTQMEIEKCRMEQNL